MALAIIVRYSKHRRCVSKTARTLLGDHAVRTVSWRATRAAYSCHYCQQCWSADSAEQHRLEDLFKAAADSHSPQICSICAICGRSDRNRSHAVRLPVSNTQKQSCRVCGVLGTHRDDAMSHNRQTRESSVVRFEDSTHPIGQLRPSHSLMACHTAEPNDTRDDTGKLVSPFPGFGGSFQVLLDMRIAYKIPTGKVSLVA